MKADREFAFTDKDFNFVRTLVHRQTGIRLTDAKRDMVYGRLARRLRVLGLDSFLTYCRMLEDQSGSDELIQFTNALTTNLTSFFREPHHFEFLARKLLPELMREHGQDRRIRIWSAGCSSGEEPYSLAMVVRETVPMDQRWDIKILATDLDSQVLGIAERGVYDERAVSKLSRDRCRRWFRPVQDGQDGLLRISPQLKELIRFRRLNLMEQWPLRGPFDVIFCRNVIIYFDKETQKGLMERYAALMGANGHLFLGHSETLYRVSDRFESIGQTIYKVKR